MSDVVLPALGSGAMFDRIARRYDFVNRVISLGMDKGWRRRTVKALQLGEHARVLDLATGTIRARASSGSIHPPRCSRSRPTRSRASGSPIA